MPTSTILQPKDGETINVLGDIMRILVDSRTSGGKVVVFEMTTQPGVGPPLHRHNREDEFFYVIEGSLKFWVDGNESIVAAGGSVFAPKGSVHAFKNTGKVPARAIVQCTPGGIEVPFRICHELGLKGQVNPQTVTEAMAQYGVDIMGPPL